MAQTPLPGGPNIIQTPLTDKDGKMVGIWQLWYVNVIQRIQNGLDIIGRFTGQIATDATLEGHPGTIGSTLQHLTASGQLIASELTGVIASAQLPPADPAAQGAVLLPAGAPTNVLGSAALQPDTAFDPAGSAATAQAAAEAASDPLGSATAALGSANAYTNGRFGITYGVGAPVGVPTTTFALYFDTTGTPYHGYVYNGGWQQFS